ncbi:MAG: GNAT family N-acetyltransferase [Bdellovibrionota bacterium]
MKQQPKLAQKTDIPAVLEQLRKNGVKNSWAIQDMLVWPDRSKLYFSQDGNAFSYVLVTGHPASHGHPTLIADGEPAAVLTLLKAANVTEPCVIRETSAALIEPIRAFYPNAKVFLEKRMDVTKASYTPRHTGKARSLSAADAEALAAFFGAPPQAAGRFKGWLGGSKLFMGIFEGTRIAAIGSSMVSVPESWNLVSIETHKDFRGRGLGTEIVSALVEQALKSTSTVTVTVVTDNQPAVKTYQKVGFGFTEDRIWVDNGTGSEP